MNGSMQCVTGTPARAEMLAAMLAAENAALTLAPDPAAAAASNADIIFADAEMADALAGAAGNSVVVALCDAANAAENGIAAQSAAHDIIALPCHPVEFASRLKSLMRIRMLRDELAQRSGPADGQSDAKPGTVLVLGSAKARARCAALLAQGGGSVEAEDDMSGLIIAARGVWSCIVLAVDDASRDPSLVVRQLKSIGDLRGMPILVFGDPSGAREAAALAASGADMLSVSASAGEARKRVAALAGKAMLLARLRASVLRGGTGRDAETGLADSTELQRVATISCRRLQAQGKPAALLLIGIDGAGHHVETAEPTIEGAMTQGVVRVLQRGLRGFDFASRHAPDVFAIFMPGTNAEGARSAADRLINDMKAERIRGHAAGANATCSIGIAALEAGGPADAEALIWTAAAALEEARSKGAATVCIAPVPLAA
jgi:two-component system, cell cycle response regulator